MKMFSTFQIISAGKSLRHLCALLGLILVSGCAVTDAPKSMNFDGGQRWVLLPVQNHSGVPQAGERVEGILGTLLPIRGLSNFQVYPMPDVGTALPELDERRRYEQSMVWARSHGFALGITGSVDEWRYKSGAEGEPAVGLNVQVVEIETGKVLWSATGARSGWGRETVGGTGQKLLRELLANVEITRN